MTKSNREKTQAIEKITVQVEGLIEQATGLGLDREGVFALVERVRKEHEPPPTVLRETKTPELLKKIEDRLVRALDYLDDAVLAKATANQLAVVIGILIDKRQLLSGEPTLIMSHQERQDMDKLLPLLIKEMERRKALKMKTIDGTAYRIEAERPPNNV